VRESVSITETEALKIKVVDLIAKNLNDLLEKIDGKTIEKPRGKIKLATKGLSNQDIADELCLSLRTVQAHLGHIFNKLQVSSRTEAVVRALKEGWVTLEDVT
jgi:DNA-binding NarL/FixJ family response regulator